MIGRQSLLAGNALYSFQRDIIKKQSLLHHPLSVKNICRLLCLESGSSNKNVNEDIAGLYEAYNSIYLPTPAEMVAKGFDISIELASKIINVKKPYMPDKLENNINLAKIEFPTEITSKEGQKIVVRLSAHRFPRFDHNLQIMKEISMPLTLNNVNRLDRYSQEKISKLMDMGLIDPNIDIPLQIFAQMEATQDILDQLPKKDAYHDMKFIELWRNLQDIFLKWHFKKDISIARKSLVNWPGCFRLRSLMFQNQNINLLRKCADFKQSKLVGYISIIIGNPKFIEENLQYNKHVNGMNLRSLISKHPPILFSPLNHIRRTEAMLNYIHVQQKTLLTHLMVFAYQPCLILHRIETLIKMTSLLDLRLTPNNISFLIQFERCMEKMKALEKEFGKFDYLPPVSFLLKENKTNTNNKTSKMKTILSFLETFLGIPGKEAHDGVLRLNLVDYPSLQCLKENYTFLLKENFSKELIRRSYHVLLFPPDILKETYHKKLPESKYAHEFIDANELHKLLQLLIYYTGKNLRKLGGSNA